MLPQVTDYAERVNRPGDFATLRQKNKDGMYNTLEQFEVHLVAHFPNHPLFWTYKAEYYQFYRLPEIHMQLQNDVYMVFQKAMSINSEDTIPYREVGCIKT